MFILQNVNWIKVFSFYKQYDFIQLLWKQHSPQLMFKQKAYKTGQKNIQIINLKIICSFLLVI